jgi:hypothetical protein
MKTFNSFASFCDANRLQIAWADEFKCAGLTYRIYEYGDADSTSYVYFLNKKTGNLIYVVYDCPSYQYVDGKRIQTKEYHMYSMELQDYKPSLWR